VSVLCNFNYGFMNNPKETLRNMSFVFHTFHNPRYHTKKLLVLIQAARGSVVSTNVLSFI